MPAGSFKSVSANIYDVCAVRTDDVIACWGNNDRVTDYGQTVVPAGKFRSVTAGLYHTCAIRTDDAVACWGRNDDGQA